MSVADPVMCNLQHGPFDAHEDPEALLCGCVQPSDNDQGFCMGCGEWINYRERNSP